MSVRSAASSPQLTEYRRPVTAYPNIPSYKETIRSSAKAEAIDLCEVVEAVLAQHAPTSLMVVRDD